MLKLINIIFFTLIPSFAFAQTAPAAASTQSQLMSFVPLVLIFIIFYFLLIRPQQKKAKAHQALINDLKIGNDVCTVSGIFGKVRKIDDKENLVFLEVAPDVVITVLKASVNQVLDSNKIAKIEKADSTKAKAKKSKK